MDMVHIQGSLQKVFDALFELGVIEPVLKMNWNKHLRELEVGSEELNQAVRVINSCSESPSVLRAELRRFNSHTLEILAMEVAREYASFHSRQALH
jgi:hypothetical protein